MSSNRLYFTPRRKLHDQPPDHHVLAAPPVFSQLVKIASPKTSKKTPSQEKKVSRPKTIGFRNPWPSHQKLKVGQIRAGLEWGKANTSSEFEDVITQEENARDVTTDQVTVQPVRRGSDSKVVEELLVKKPQWGAPTSEEITATWLGHAGVMLQMPGLDGQGMVRIVVDPIFSERCFFSQNAGPLRSYPPPCTLAELPPIDIFVISHNHYDHLDSDTVTTLWRANRDRMKFIVPLGNGDWFKEAPLSVPADRIIELDWWDDSLVTSTAVEEEKTPETPYIKITCTPAQHNSGRFRMDSGAALWASWYFEYFNPNKNPVSHYRVYFAGDTGFQIHGPEGPTEESAYPKCPAFEQISLRLGAPDLNLLPISVGATAGFLKKNISFFPRVNPSIMSANHVGAWDAVRLHRLMRDAGEGRKDKEGPISMAIHWGTFVGGDDDVTQSINDLKRACHSQGVKYGRLPEGGKVGHVGSSGEFLLINHGETIRMQIANAAKNPTEKPLENADIPVTVENLGLRESKGSDFESESESDEEFHVGHQHGAEGKKERKHKFKGKIKEMKQRRSLEKSK